MKEITSPSNPIVKELVKLREKRAAREETQSLLLLGKKMLPKKVKTLIVVDESSIPRDLSFDELYLVSEPVMKKIWGVVSPEKVAAVVSLPPPGKLSGMRRILALDRVSDPGNLGTLLRTACAFGWDAAFLLDGTCDPYNDKALRAAKGATLTFPIKQGSFAELHHLIEENGAQAFAADVKGAPPPKNVDGSIVLILGNESCGLSKEARKNCEIITLPMTGKMESLNVAIAGGILLYELR